ncbi:MAG TPA: hypothetical protein DD435_10360 [Cyanobacteria bacterium UBA8530]|nr:hypothetical protein [Cyanobacteria bacterium UBA8530]
MKHSVSIGLLVLGLGSVLAGCPTVVSTNDAKASPSPTATPGVNALSNDYFPMANQERWDYSLTLSGQPIGTMTMYIKALQVAADGVVTAEACSVSTSLLTGAPVVTVDNSIYTMSANSVTCKDSLGNTSKLLQLPLTVGESWMDAYQHPVQVASHEAVVVPIGSFADTYKVVGTHPSGTPQSCWFAKDRGLVKIDTVTPYGTTSAMLVSHSIAPMDIPTPTPTN